MSTQLHALSRRHGKPANGYRTAEQLEHYRPNILLLPGPGPLTAAWLASNQPFYAAVGEVRVAGDEVAISDPAALQSLVDTAELVVVGDLPEAAVVAVDWRGVDAHLVVGLAGFDRPLGTLGRVAERLRSARCFVLLALERVTLGQAGAAHYAHMTATVALFGDRPPGPLYPFPTRAEPPGLLILSTPRERYRALRLLAQVESALPGVEAKLACHLPLDGHEVSLATIARWLLGEGRGTGIVAVDLAPDALAHAALREVLLRQGQTLVPMPKNAGSAPLATLVHLLRIRPRPTPPSFRDCGFEWMRHHLKQRKRCRFSVSGYGA